MAARGVDGEIYGKTAEQLRAEGKRCVIVFRCDGCSARWPEPGGCVCSDNGDRVSCRGESPEIAVQLHKQRVRYKWPQPQP